MNLSLRLAALFLTALNFFQASAQQTVDSTLFSKSVSSIHQVYFTQIGDNALIYQGNEYIRSGLKASGFPYYQADSMFTGTISYLGTTYPEKKFYYDLLADQLITYNYTHDALIRLSSEKVDSFSIGPHTFIYLRADKMNGLNGEGFYEKLFSGNPSLYVKREKILSSASGNEEQKYIQKNSFYIRKKHVFFLVDSKNSQLDLLSDHRDALKEYIRTSKIDYKKDFENALLLSTIYYSGIKN